ncbi:MAG: prepilin peptidase [Ardenticatenaceae bacterium]|nr:prepilin peptidase [Ardenticatenaceae bacterium]MCB9444372.1 prepilin peptidase [Ardenticatenaceae bacterium]
MGLLIGVGLLWLGKHLPRYFRSPAELTAYHAPLWLDGLILVVTGGLYAYWGVRPGLSWATAVPLLGSTALILIAVIDLRYRLIFNLMMYPAIVLVLLFHLFFSGRSLLVTLLGGLFAFFIFYFTLLLRPGDLGGGDVKLALLIGLALGFPTVLWALLLGVGSGAVTAVTLLLIGRQSKKQVWNRKSQIPYAPFLCLGAILALLYNPFPFAIF